ncbi:bifunctional demethylmenaquinone methyltransferase/2-methoxy-6-polyprenyl-1,4-benzoquinol methylase UbiE [Geomonas sp. Red32]|uniref:bifunctional demethylmenaquinone methyltransferase/2-methoxy-6-polyprenyl-1,4-benzoquinol methylase UbiE n=1 Tax=Geomonas sp. Red32 TaxID=2912856 RepID=UPI00202CBBB7|nr:bifunctional demethylmenaquinone methyltransferase/2-methoxy-6-polyprenyl-1,4-benzoquinol methylase UbiE [Geomonas sp. Red32]MCM0082756.1 bifunctional demethylmenaquinone methyltransferase/2-methoxy-6-polyprenyl-1,4-benzoquinol methylase UbiE [Geomonas sp. Red32]
MYALSEKGERIRAMFGSIAPRYDFLNRLLSLGIDRRWRRFAVGKIGVSGSGKVLDVATGTGDVALEIASQTAPSLEIVGIDFCKEMVDLGKVKVAGSRFAGRISLQVAPCEDIPFPDQTFDAATISFGIRNVVDRPAGLAEMHRVLKGGGRVVILEFSTPTLPVFKQLYHFYFLKVLPKIGGMFSRMSAYQYLPDSVLEFPSRDEFKGMMSQVGFQNVQHFDLTGGIATVYLGVKKAS